MKRRGLLVLLVVIASLALLAGCSRSGGKTPPDTSNNQDVQVVTLYFSDDQAEYLVAEEREVTVTAPETLAEVIVNELIKGSNSGLGQTMPDETKLLTLKVEEGIAYVDFSCEFQENHWGGTAGESMTVYSLVNSLAKLDGIDKVQFLLEGEIKEEILGHMYYAEPIEPNWDLVQ